MKMLELIIAVSIIMWYIIDRFKPLWADLSWGKYITIAVSAVMAGALCANYQLDIMAALGAVETVTPLGIVLTAFAMMSGSSAVAEIVARVKGNG